MKYIYIIAVLFIFSACNKSLENKYNKDSYENDIISLFDNQLINEDDKNLLSDHIIKNQSDSIALAKSYGELLTIAKEEKAIKEESERERLERKKQLNESITVEITKKRSWYDYYGKQYLLLDVTIENKTEKAIAGFTVNINFKNSKDISFYSSQWSIPIVIEANTKVKNTLSTGEFDNNNIPQSQLKMADLSKVQIEYEITKIMYDDGTSLDLY